MIEDVEPCPLLDDRKERDDGDATHDELRDQVNAGNARDDAGDEVVQKMMNETKSVTP